MNDNQAIRAVRALADSPENLCFACGPGNERGLHLHFTTDGTTARAEFSPEDWQYGWQGVVHGGILATLLDEALAYVLFFRGIQAMTARMDIRYRRPVRSNERLTVEAQLVRNAPKIADVRGAVLRDGAVVAEATGRFVKVGELVSLDLGQPAGVV
ncbi:MAG: PaaI family thioesterase, partial [Chloroflexota bacterium]